MKVYNVPIVIERYQVLEVKAPNLEEAIILVEEGTNKDISEYGVDGTPLVHPISPAAHVEIDWELVDSLNEEHESMPRSDDELYGDVDAYSKGPLHREDA